MRHILLLVLLGACAGGDSDGEVDDDIVDLGEPHFRLTVDGTPLDWREAWVATAAGESSLNISAMDQPTGDRDGFGFTLPAAVGSYDCIDVRATYSRIRDNSTSVTMWPTLNNEGSECAVDLTEVSAVEGEHLVGTFAFTIPGTAQELVITDGSFRLPYAAPQ